MKIYIAAPFFNERQLEIVKNVEAHLEKFGLDFFSPRSGGVLKDMSERKQEETKREIYLNNIYEMDQCTHMIACVEEKDTGTNFEIGYFAAKEKPVVLFSEKIETVNVMLAEAAISICDEYSALKWALSGYSTFKIKNYT